MDTNHSHGLTQRERLEIQTRIQRLQWLLKECIGIEEYELCTQIRNVINKKYELLATNNTTNEVE
jgi:protein-arginine kinase activator protein McsA